MPHKESSKSNEQENDYTIEQFVTDHLYQLQSSAVPPIYWETLHVKLKTEVFDAGLTFQILCVEEADGSDSEGDDSGSSTHSWKVVCSQEEGIQCEDPKHIYLIDHAWTYRVNDAKSQLLGVPGLLERMVALTEVDTEGKAKEDIVEEVFSELWRFNQTYRIANAQMGSEEALPIWYIMDEFGSRIQHSDTPTFKTCPLFYAPTQMSFTLLWPLQNLDAGDEVTRDYIPSIQNSDTRQACLIPWIPQDMKDVSYSQEEPDISYFEAFKMEEKSPNLNVDFPGLPKDRNIRVYIDLEELAKHLTDERFEQVKTIGEADIIWTKSHWRNFRKLSEESPAKFINQFPFEGVLTVKDLLAFVCRRAGTGVIDPVTMETTPKWLPTTYSLQTELHKFVSFFQHREEKGLDNHWICKPWNLARGLDMHITNNLNYILRLTETGPKIACKYVEDPVMFYREEVGNVKFDIRYIVMLSSVHPLKLYVYRVFWLRFANKPFSLDHFEDYEKHFTVMNYVEEGKKLKQIHYDDFIPMFESQYPAYKWEDVESSIFDMFREMFQAAVEKPGPCGISSAPQSRAIYAVDLLLKWDKNEKGEKTMQPVLCEVNFCPDCNRACKYHPDFMNDVFSALFMDDIEGRPVTLL